MLLDCISKMAHRARIFHFIHKLESHHCKIYKWLKNFSLVFIQILEYQLVVADKLCY